MQLNNMFDLTITATKSVSGRCGRLNYLAGGDEMGDELQVGRCRVTNILTLQLTGKLKYVSENTWGRNRQSRDRKVIANSDTSARQPASILHRRRCISCSPHKINGILQLYIICQRIWCVSTFSLRRYKLELQSEAEPEITQRTFVRCFTAVFTG